jgi:hypothetical protein
MGKVFITQQAHSFDLSQAEDFGKPVVIWAPTQQAYGDTTQLVLQARRVLADFNPDEDYLLPVGDPALMCIAAAEVSFVTEGMFKLLKWDRRAGQYGGYRVVAVDTNVQPT